MHEIYNFYKYQKMFRLNHPEIFAACSKAGNR
ncbi:hypothetical protein EMIT047CA2_80236 [Pseudomonas soli]